MNVHLDLVHMGVHALMVSGTTSVSVLKGERVLHVRRLSDRPLLLSHVYLIVVSIQTSPPGNMDVISAHVTMEQSTALR